METPTSQDLCPRQCPRQCRDSDTVKALNHDVHYGQPQRSPHTQFAIAEDNDTACDAKYWLAVHRAPRIGCRTYLKLLMALASPQAILAASDERLRGFKLSVSTRQALREPDWQAIQQDLDWLAAHNGSLLTLADTAYPQALKQIPDPPPVLFVLGNIGLLSQPQIAMVGSRNPTPGGSQTAYDFAAALARTGLTVTSGMALGVDGQCHRGALSVSSSASQQASQMAASSIAVIGTGIDRVYPARHKNLAKLLAERGAIVSEFPLGTPPLAQNFPLRNRIISGLSLGVVVVEAALQSGSLITARQALEQNREVFAIPGSIHTPQSRGCHALIRQGAKLVEIAEDVLEEIQFTPEFIANIPAPIIDKKQADESEPPKNGVEIASASEGTLSKALDRETSLDENQQLLLSCVGFEPTSMDEIIARCGLTAERVCSMLLILELQNIIVSTANGQYTRIKAHTNSTT